MLVFYQKFEWISGLRTTGKDESQNKSCGTTQAGQILLSFTPLFNSAFTITHEWALHWPTKPYLSWAKAAESMGKMDSGIIFLDLLTSLFQSPPCSWVVSSVVQPLNLLLCWFPSWLLIKGVVLRDIQNYLNSTAEVSRSENRNVIYKCLYCEYCIGFI